MGSALKRDNPYPEFCPSSANRCDNVCVNLCVIKVNLKVQFLVSKCIFGVWFTFRRWSVTLASNFQPIFAMWHTGNGNINLISCLCSNLWRQWPKGKVLIKKGNCLFFAAVVYQIFMDWERENAIHPIHFNSPTSSRQLSSIIAVGFDDDKSSSKWRGGGKLNFVVSIGSLWRVDHQEQISSPT